MWKCPGCGGDNLDVLVTVWARLSQWKEWRGRELVPVFGTDADSGHDGGHEWDEDSVMYCLDCMKQDRASKFETEGEED